MNFSLKPIRNFYRKSVQFLTEDIWNVDNSMIGTYKAKLFKHIKVVLITIKNFKKQNIGWQAVALSFFSTMSFVPIVALIFMVTNGFGLGEYLKALIYQNFTNEEILNMVMNFADNIIKTANEGPYGAISFLFFVWLVIWLMLCVEKCFNRIWKVEKSRIIWKRALSYLGIIIIVPFILILFLSMALTITDGINTIGLSIPYFDSVSHLLIWAIFYIFATLLFWFMYCVIPNAKVKLVPALKAALVSALAFTIIQYLYLETQVFVSRMNAVYGVFAAIPLFMVWVNFGWFVILIGSEIAYAFQNLDYYKNEYTTLWNSQKQTTI